MKTVGFIGVGMIGRPVATCILKGGFDLIVHDINPDAVAALVADGARAAGSIAEAAAAGDVVITMLPDAPDVEAAVLGPGGIAESIRADAIYIDMSTIDPGTTRKVGVALSQRGVRMIDCPVTRSVAHAWEGKLALLIGGEAAVIEEVRPILDCVADLVTHCGALGNGSAMKLVNNFMAAGIVSVVSESLAIGLKAGLSLDTIMGATGRSGTFNKILLEVLPSHAFQGDFAAGFMCRLALKDHRLAMTLAQELGVEAPVGETVFGLLEAVAAQYPTEDFTSLLRLREEQAGFRARLEDTAG